VNFYDLATRLTDRIRPVNEEVATLAGHEQKMINKYGQSMSMIRSNYGGEEYYKFWVLTDGTVIWVEYDHGWTARLAGTNHGDLMDSGAVRGYANDDNGELAIQWNVMPNYTQIEQITKIATKLNMKRMISNSWGEDEKSHFGLIKSPEHIDYIIRYGNIEEKKLKEDGAAPSGGPAPAADGMTTENDIAALPTEIGRGRGRGRRRKKRTPVIGVKEAVEEDLSRLRKELKQQMVKLMNRDEFQVTADAVRSFQSTFGEGRPRTQRVAIKVERQQKDAQKLYGDILREHGDDRGSLEMVIAAMQEGRPLGQFAGMSKYDYLYGTRVEVTFQGIDLVFEAKVDFIYDPTQSMYVGDDELVDRIEEEFGRFIKRKKNVIYPVGGKFHPDFFDQLKSMMSDSQEPEHEKQSEEIA